MIEATPMQARVLAALHAHTLAATELLSTADGFDGPAQEQWLACYHHHAVAGQDLADVARASGVPPIWIARACEQGKDGATWTPVEPLTNLEPIDWDRVLTELTGDVATIQQWQALDAAHRRLGPGSPPAEVAGLRTNLDTLRMRTTAVANLMGLTLQDGRELWGDSQTWAQHSLAALDAIPAEHLVDRRHAVATTDLRAYAGQATALAGLHIPTDSSPALPPAATVQHRIREEIDPVQPLFVPAALAESYPDMSVDAARAAAIPGPVFSEAPDTGYEWAYPPESVDVDLVFCAPTAEGAEL